MKTEECCEVIGGVYQGDGVQCLGDNDGDEVDDICDGGPGDEEGPCCLPSGVCTLVPPSVCEEMGGVSLPDADCGMTGACCLDDGDCIVTTEKCCAEMGGEYKGDGVQCDDAVCGEGPCPPCPPCPPERPCGPVGVVPMAAMAFTLLGWGLMRAGTSRTRRRTR